MIPIAPHITSFLQDRLARQRRCSPHTCDSYAYAFQLLFTFASERLAIAPSQLCVEHIDGELVSGFLEHLTSRRQCGPSTRNARLAAIRSFMRFLEYRVPSALEQINEILAIPKARTERRLVGYLEPKEYKAILDAPDPTTRLGIRDRAMLHLALTAGLRVSELVSVRQNDVAFDGHYLDIVIRGKGRRERSLRLWKAVAASLRQWLAVRGDASTPEVFISAWGNPLTRSGFEHVLRKHVESAARRYPPLRTRRVSPHILRHTAAVNMLRATKDVRKVALWLGHASPQTAEVYYLPVDPDEKLEALAAFSPPALRPGRFRPPDKLLAMLRK